MKAGLFVFIVFLLSATYTSAVVGCQSVAVVNTTLTENLSCSGYGLWAQNEGTVIDCAGYAIIGSGSNLGINITGTNKITVIKRRAYGFRDIEYFKLKILQLCGVKTPQNQR